MTDFVQRVRQILLGGSAITLDVGPITSSGAITDGAASSFTTGSTIGNLTLADGSITDSSGAISFNDENLLTSGTLGCGALTATGATIATTLVLATGSITDSGGAISFGNENLSTTGTFGCGALTCTGATINGTTAVNDNMTVANTKDILCATDGGSDIGSAAERFGTGHFDNIEMAGHTFSDFLDEDDMASDSATSVASQQSIKAYVDSEVPATVCGSYTGDGAVSQAITGLGFQPKAVMIVARPSGEGDAEVFWKFDDSWGDYALAHIVTATDEHYFFDNRISSLDADGFTVDDDGADEHPNKNGVTYSYIAWGAGAGNSTVKARVYLSGAQSVNSGSFQKINFDTENFDTGSDYDTTNYRFVAPESGYYAVHFSVRFDSVNDGTAVIAAIYANTAVWAKAAVRTGAAADASALVSDLVYVAAGQYIEFYGYHNHGVARDAIADVNYCWASVYGPL